MFGKQIIRQFRSGWMRMLPPFLSVTIASAVFFTLSDLALRAPSEVRRQFRGFGPNLVISQNLPPTGLALEPEPLPPAIVSKIKKNLSGFPRTYSVEVSVTAAKIGKQQVGALITPISDYLTVNPIAKIPTGKKSLGFVVGQDVASALNVKEGERLSVKVLGTTQTLPIDAVFRSGTVDDQQIWIDPQSLTERQRDKLGYSRILVRMDEVIRQLPALRKMISERFPTLKVTPLHARISAETTFLKRAARILLWLSASLLLMTSLSVMLAVAAELTARRDEIALMLSLGASRRQIFSLFYAQISILSFGGGLLGVLVGAVSRWLLLTPGRESMGMVSPVPVVLTIIFAMIFAFVGTSLPLRRIISLQPAEVLKGE